MFFADINFENDLRDAIITLSLQQHGKEYVHGKHGKNEFDCAGLCWYVYKEICGISLYHRGIGLSTTTKIMTGSFGILKLFEEDILKKDLSLLKKGNILLFHTQSMQERAPSAQNWYPGHCGIYLGEGSFIHASKACGKVVISSFSKNDYWERILVGDKDILADPKVLMKVRLKIKK